MESKITITRKLLAFLMFCLLSMTMSFAQSFPPANTSCTSGDLTLVGATLSGGDLCNSCATATPITRTLTLSINNTTGSVRTSFAFWGNLEIYSGSTGQLISSTVITGCNGPLPPNTITSLNYNTLTYNCGDIVKISNIFLAWTSASPGATCPLNPNEISPKCGTVPIITVNGGLNGEIAMTESQCGSATGALDLTPLFGTAPYTYTWTASNGGVVPAGQQNSQDLTGLIPGTYSVVIRDANGCTITKTRVLTSTTAPAAVFANTSDITVACGAATTSSLSYTNNTSGSCAITGSVTSTLSTLTPSNPSSPSCGGTIIETWTFTDALGRTITKTRTITVAPAAIPTLTPLPSITVACGDLPQSSSLTFTNGLSGSCLITGTSNPSTFSTPPSACGGTMKETWTATDSCGRTLAPVSRTIIISPAALPTMTAPANITVACGELPALSSIPFSNGLSGRCAINGTSNASTFSSMPGACGGTVTETWTAIDSCGRALAPVSRTITVLPAALPTMTAPANISVACGSLPAPSTISFTNGLSGSCLISGNSNPSTFSSTPSACGGTITETWTATDSCGRALASVSRTITISPAALPTMTAPANTTVACGSLPAPSTISFTNGLSGGCLISGTSNPSTFTSTPGACGGTVTETWTATDSCGRALAPVSRTITVSPAALPTMTALAPITVNCGGLPAASVLPFSNGLTGGCAISGTSNLSTFTTTVPGNCNGSVTETWNATDSCGRPLASVSRVITINDTTAPVIASLPGTTTINCPATPNFAQASATDNCGSIASLTFNDVRTDGACAGSYSVTRTWTAVDGCGNASTASQTINVEDTTAPVISNLPGTTTINCPATPSFATATATDACSSGATLTFVDSTNNGNCAGNYSVTRTWTAVDACGNTSTASQTINVQDVTAPTFTVPADVTINAGPNCSADLNSGNIGTVTNISDACDPNPTVTFTDSECFGNFNESSINAGSGNYFNFVVSGFDNLTAKDIKKVALAFQTNQGKGRVEFTLVSPSGQAVVLVGPYCNGGNCDVVNNGNFELYLPDFYPNASGYTQWNNNNMIPFGVSVNATPNGNLSATNTIAGVNSYVSSFENLTGPMNGTWFVYGKKVGNELGNITFKSVCLTPQEPCASNRTITRTWTVTDACGNASSATQTIKVHDVTAPVIATLPSVSTINCPATPVFAQATATDNCDNDVNLTFVDSTTPGVCAGSYSVTRTWTATDDCGNTATASQTINVQDVTAPVIAALPAPSTINCPATPVFAQATATDECGSTFQLTFTDATTNGACAGSYSVTRTWTATDACGNASTATQTINVQDITAPVIAALPAPSTVDCPATPVFAQATATDECGSSFDLTFADVTTNGACAGSYSVTRTWTATDACGNASTATQTINVQDTTAPVIAALPVPSTIDCPATPVFAQATATDECGSAFDLTFADTTTNGACAGSYSVTRTWTATDACGNASTATQTINVQDITAPVIAALPAPSTVDCPATPVFAQATATDECGSSFDLTFADVTTNGACAGSYSVTRTWTATDACGNASTATQTINVQDVTAPVIAALPADSTISCPATPVFAQATATDECGSTFELTFADVTTDGTCVGSYSVTRTWTATDACGNASTATQTIHVQDITAPTINTQASNIIVECDGNGNGQALQNWLNSNGGASASDACSSVTWSNNFSQIGNDCSSAVTVIFTATDACGNASTTSATFTINDTQNPVIATLPGASTITCPATPVFAQATATDNCDTNVNLSFVDATTNGACAGSYSVTRTWTATDDCGNTSTASQTINVQDLTAPVIAALPAASTVDCPATPNFAQAVATDECGSAIDLTFVDATTNGNCAGSYSVTRTWTATDACGNASTATQTINVQDVTAPVIATLPAASTINCPATPVFAQATATDECGSTFELTFADATTNGTCAGSYSVTRTWTAIDACGNTSTATQTINVQDVTPPMINTQATSITVECDGSGNGQALQAWLASNGGATASDDCSTVAWSNDFNQIANDCSAAVTVIFTATDACGNASTSTGTFTIHDTQVPVIATLPVTSTINCPATPSFAQATATDNCDTNVDLTFVDATTNGDCAGSYSVTRTWTATDTCGNTATATQTINVQDITAPIIASLPAPSTITCPATPAFAQATATDDCGSAINLTFVDDTINGNCAGSYSITRTWTATDACGNASTASQTINVQDNVPPTFTAPADIEIFTTAQCTYDANVTITGDVTDEADNCSTGLQATFTDNIADGSCAGSKIITRTWSLVDECGNAAASQTQTITVTDNIAPTFTAPADIEIFTTATCSYDASVGVTGDVTDEADNCSADLQATFADSVADGPCAGSKIITRTWSLVDACGNSAPTQTQTITVTDNIAPTFTAPANIEIFTAADCSYDASVTITGDVTDEADNCSTGLQATFADTVADGPCTGSKIITRTWSLVDACGNAAAPQIQVITVTDNLAPVAPQAPASISATCSAEVPAMISLTALDNCSGSITVNGVDSVAQGSCPNSFTVTRTWTFTDSCGNTSSVSQTISVNDNIPPVFNIAAPADTTAACDNIPTPAVLTAIDNCGTATVNMTETILAGSCPSNYQIVRTWIATDACGNNSAAVSQTISVSDTVGPIIINPLDPKIAVNCGAIPVAPVLTAADFTDNCSTVNTPVFTQTQTQPSNGTYQIVRTWTVTDACGNTTVVTQNIQVTQTTDVSVIPKGSCTNEDISYNLTTIANDVDIPAGSVWVNESNVGGFTNGDTFNAFHIAAGTYTFSYIITTGICPRKVEIKMTVNTDCGVLPCESIVIHNAFTPNGDAFNQWFQIDHIEDFDCYPTNNVQIYNRWGILVYETKNYDNLARRFEGISEGRATVNKSEELPTGTYFYIIQWTTTDGQTVNKDGYLYLTR